MDQAIAQVNGAMTQIRHFIEGGLLPEPLSQQDFSNALQTLVTSLGKISSTQVHVEIDSEAAQSVTETQRLELLAIGEEALSNCLRHAQATQVWVSLQPHGR